MSKKEHENIRKILREIEGKIQWLQQKSVEIVQSEEVQHKIQQLTKHKENIDKELSKTKNSLEQRVSLARPHISQAGTELKQALLSLVGKQSSAPTKKVRAKKSQKTQKTSSSAAAKKSQKTQKTAAAAKKKSSTTTRKTKTSSSSTKKD